MSPRPITENTLFYSDNLNILRQYIPDESVDLIYLDPPFNSSRSYNVLFKDEHGTESEAQIEAFEDTWHWNLEAEQTYAELLTEAPDHNPQEHVWKYSKDKLSNQKRDSLEETVTAFTSIVTGRTYPYQI